MVAINRLRCELAIAGDPAVAGFGRVAGAERQSDFREERKCEGVSTTAAQKVFRRAAPATPATPRGAPAGLSGRQR